LNGGGAPPVDPHPERPEAGAWGAAAGSMTLLSCLALGLAFVIAVGLLTLAGILLGWFAPKWIERLRAGGPRPRGPAP